jgi:hypothetical protein
MVFYLILNLVVAEVEPVADAVRMGVPAIVSLYQKLTMLEPLLMVTDTR